MRNGKVKRTPPELLVSDCVVVVVVIVVVDAVVVVVVVGCGCEVGPAARTAAALVTSRRLEPVELAPRRILVPPVWPFFFPVPPPPAPAPPPPPPSWGVSGLSSWFWFFLGGAMAYYRFMLRDEKRIEEWTESTESVGGASGCRVDFQIGTVGYGTIKQRRASGWVVVWCVRFVAAFGSHRKVQSGGGGRL